MTQNARLFLLPLIQRYPKLRRAFPLMNLRQDQSRRVKDLVHCPDAVILEIIASYEVHIFMQRIQRRDQILPASCPVIRLAAQTSRASFWKNGCISA